MSEALRCIGTVPAGSTVSKLEDGAIIFVHPEHPVRWINPATWRIEDLPPAIDRSKQADGR